MKALNPNREQPAKPCAKAARRGDPSSGFKVSGGSDDPGAMKSRFSLEDTPSALVVYAWFQAPGAEEPDPSDFRRIPGSRSIWVAFDTRGVPIGVMSRVPKGKQSSRSKRHTQRLPRLLGSTRMTLLRRELASVQLAMKHFAQELEAA